MDVSKPKWKWQEGVKFGYFLTFLEIIHSSPGVLLNYNVFRNKEF